MFLSFNIMFYFSPIKTWLKFFRATIMLQNFNVKVVNSLLSADKSHPFRSAIDFAIERPSPTPSDVLSVW